jgi:hypothetical protein
MKTIVPLDHPDLLAQLVLMANTDPMEPRAPLVQSALAKDSNIPINQQVVKNARMEPKDPLDPLDLPDLLVPKVNQAERAEMVNPVDPAQLAQLVVQVPREAMVKQAPKANQAKTQILEAKAQPAGKEKREAQVQLELKATMEPLVKPVPPDHLDPLVHQAKEAKMEPKDPLVPLDHLEDPAQTLSTARAHIVPRKHKRSHRRIIPNTILGQYGFDNDQKYFQYHHHHLKIIVSIMLLIYTSV